MSSDGFTTCLWFDGQAEEAAAHYVSIFKNSRIGRVTHYGEGAPQPAGSVLTVDFVANGQRFVALNGGPQFKFTEAVSFFISVDTQEEIDYYWDKLIAGGGEPSMCGWLKDKFGLSWQVIPRKLMEYQGSSDRAAAERSQQAMLKMRKIVIADLDKAYAGK
jgi:predicted 3-demethylubiquinone-9 3-methyltransferase (glyoxalase superfamily)